MRKLRPCNNCGKKTRNPKFCSRSCSGQYTAEHKENWKCRNCGKDTPQPSAYASLCEECQKTAKKEIPIFSKKCLNCEMSFETTSTIKVFCNPACYATAKTKRYQAKYGFGQAVCHLCGYKFNKTSGQKQKYCSDNCRIIAKISVKDKITIGQVRERYKNNKYGRQNIHSLIRARARSKIQFVGWDFCMFCGYNKYVEACHIIPVVNFNDATPIAEVNALTNLFALCPTHHIEMDLLNILSEVEIKKTKYYQMALQVLKLKAGDRNIMVK